MNIWGGRTDEQKKKKKEKKAETHICHACEEDIYPEDEQEYVKTKRNTKMWFHRKLHKETDVWQ